MLAKDKEAREQVTYIRNATKAKSSRPPRRTCHARLIISSRMEKETAVTPDVSARV
jgi:hypothetical protein